MAVEDNGPVIVGVTWFLCFISGGFLALRLYAKLSRRQGLWWDDYILLFAWVRTLPHFSLFDEIYHDQTSWNSRLTIILQSMLFIESVITQVGQVLGFGKHTADIPVENLPTIALGTSIAASISCFASTFSKISFGVTLLRLTSHSLRAFVWFCIITLFFVMLPSALLSWIQCRPIAKAWNSLVEGECWDPRVVVYYGIFNAAWCAWIDFALALIPWKLVWGLNLRTREKIGVGIAMSMGLLAGICAIVKGVYLVQLREQDFFCKSIRQNLGGECAGANKGTQSTASTLQSGPPSKQQPPSSAPASPYSASSSKTQSPLSTTITIPPTPPKRCPFPG